MSVWKTKPDSSKPAMPVPQESLPAYPKEEKGACIAVASALTALKDFEAACRKRPYARIMAINRAAQFVKCDFLFSIDRWNLDYWRRLQIVNFHVNTFSVHSIRPTVNGVDKYPHVDYWWPSEAGSGTSAWAGAKVALYMGFDEVILCGAPLEPGPYFDGVAAVTFDDARNVTNMRHRIEHDSWAHPYIKSMSGWTKEFLGSI